MRTPRYRSTGKIVIPFVRDETGGHREHGEWVANPTPTAMTTIGNIQPNLTYNQMRMLPEGDRSKRAIAIYCNTELLMAIEGLPQPRDADIVTWEGKQWRVMFSMYYQMGILDHCEAIGILVDIV